MYGRFGTCVGRHPTTLTAYLIDVVNLVSGHLDEPGGSVFATMGAPGQRLSMALMGAGAAPVLPLPAQVPDRGFRQVVGAEPAAIMAKEIATEGRDRIRALFVSAGNPVLSVPNGDELEAALAGLELMVGLDLYVTETTAHCDYLLPVTTMCTSVTTSRWSSTTTPFRQATEAVVAPYGQCRSEWGHHRRAHRGDFSGARRCWRRGPGPAGWRAGAGVRGRW